MTERQGGSDDRHALDRRRTAGRTYRLAAEVVRHVPWADLVLILAMATAGLTCFGPSSATLVSRIELLERSWVGTVSVLARSSRTIPRADSARRAGVAAIMRMIASTRLDVLLENVASMRLGVLARCTARDIDVYSTAARDASADARRARGVALEAEAATAGDARSGELRLGRDRLGRLALPILDTGWRSARPTRGGSDGVPRRHGFVEASGMPRCCEVGGGSDPEGSGNVAALDVLRAVRRDGAAFDAFAAECRLAAGADTRLDGYMSATLDAVPAGPRATTLDTARAIVERLHSR